MTFPVIIRHRKPEATVYGRTKGYPFYRVSAYVGGKRRLASYRTYSEARAAARKLVRDVSSGSQAAALTPGQASDARAALERLEGFHQQTGRRVSLLAAVSEYAEAAAKLQACTLGEAAEICLSSLGSVKARRPESRTPDIDS
jgi:hypothetical protein